MTDQLARTAETTKALAGKRFEYTYSRGMKARLEIGEDTVSWEILAGPNAGEKGTHAYLAREIAEDIHLVQWFEPEDNSTITLVINEMAGSISSSEAYEGERMFDTAIIHKT
ncbi:MAG: MoaF N-terminal domain-containing protein [Pseudomonadota bacterium]